MKKIYSPIFKLNKNKLSGIPSLDKPWEYNFFGVRRSLKKTNPDIPDMNIYDYILKCNKKHLKSLKLEYFNINITFDILFEKVEECAKSFKALGIKEGNVVTLCMPNIPELLICLFALNKIGAICNILRSTSTKEELKYILNVNDKKHGKTNVLIAFSRCVDKIENIINETELKNVVVVSPYDSLSKGMNLSKRAIDFIKNNYREIPKNDKFIDWNHFVLKGKNYNKEILSIGKKETPSIVAYTSGTSGTPKPCLLSNKNIIASHIYIMNTANTPKLILKRMKALTVVPANYPFGLVTCVLVQLFNGTSVIFAPDLTPNTLSQILQDNMPDIVQAVPSTYEALLENKNISKKSLSNIKMITSGGEFLSEDLYNRVNKKMKNSGSIARLKNGSGNAEGSGCQTSVLGARIKLNSVGKPLIGLNEKIINQETNQEVSYNQEGIICYSGDTTMIRYFDEDIYNKNINNNKGKQQKIIDDNGVEWLCTGSKGYIDEDGYVFLTGRNSYIITYEAEGSPIKIYTDMIRNKICECNAIDNCVVVGQKVDDYRSYAPKVYITLKYGYVYDEELRKILIEKCKTELSLSALPNSIECIASMPLTDAGKINYIYLEQMANKESINTPAVFKKRKK